MKYFLISFREKAAIQRQVYKDQPMKPLDLAVYWVEYVIRNDGAEHLKSNSIGLNDINYFLFDVAMVIIVTTGLSCWLCSLVVVRIMNYILPN